jgi:hypothetical protein
MLACSTAINTKGHGLKFQTLEVPDGLGISCIRAHYDGRRGDGYIIKHSNLEKLLAQPSNCM